MSMDPAGERSSILLDELCAVLDSPRPNEVALRDALARHYTRDEDGFLLEDQGRLGRSFARQPGGVSASPGSVAKSMAAEFGRWLSPGDEQRPRGSTVNFVFTHFSRAMTSEGLRDFRQGLRPEDAVVADKTLPPPPPQLAYVDAVSRLGPVAPDNPQRARIVQEEMAATTRFLQQALGEEPDVLRALPAPAGAGFPPSLEGVAQHMVATRWAWIQQAGPGKLSPAATRIFQTGYLEKNLAPEARLAYVKSLSESERNAYTAAVGDYNRDATHRLPEVTAPAPQAPRQERPSAPPFPSVSVAPTGKP